MVQFVGIAGAIVASLLGWLSGGLTIPAASAHIWISA
jgi:hypothetical protein